MVVTGIPGHGKSTWVMNLCVNLARAWLGLRGGLIRIPTVPALRFKLGWRLQEPARSAGTVR